MLREIDAATLRPGRETTLGAFLVAWVEGRQHQVRPSTYEGYKWYLSKYVYPALGDTSLTELDPADLTRLYSSLHLSPKSLRNLHGILRRALRDAVAWGYAERNVAALVQPPSNPRREMLVWSPEEMRAFLEHVADDWLYPAWLLFATTGMRRGEVSGLRWTDLDLTDARLYVRAPRVVVAGQAVTSQPKTTAGRRTLSLDPTTVAALRGHPRYGPLVFSWPDGRPLSPELLSKWFRRHAEAAGLPRVRLHDLRHSYASLALSNGVPLHVVSARLGHSSPNVTLSVYSHALPAQDAEAASTVAAQILRPPAPRTRMSRRVRRLLTTEIEGAAEVTLSDVEGSLPVVYGSDPDAQSAVLSGPEGRQDRD